MEWGLKFMNSIKDIGLRRLYKFIIKRILGRYLSEELHLSQVEVNTREGIVRLMQISLDCEVLNEELNNLLVDKDTSTAKPPPVRIAAVNIRELTAHISYSTILTESCHFIASGVEVVIIPTDRTSAPTLSHVHSQDNDESFDTKGVSNNSNHPLTEENNFFGTAQSEDGQKGLSFIANWIEIIIARLHVSITDLDILLRSHRGDDASGSNDSSSGGDGGSGVHARLSLRDIRFFNSSEFSSGSSVSDSMLLSESLTNNTSPTSSKMTILSLSAKKTIFVASLRLEICRPELPEPFTSFTTTANSTTTVISFDKEMRVNVKMDRRSADISEGGMDVDVSVPECVFHVTAADVKDISVLLFAYDVLKKDGPHSTSDASKDSKKSETKSSSSSDLKKSLLGRVLKSDPTMKALLWLAEYGKEVDKDAERADGAIDYDRIVQLMQNIHQGKGSGVMTESARRADDFSSLLSMSTKIVAEPESDEEDFTGDDYRDGDSDSDVEDDNDAQNNGEKHSRNLMKSSFGQSTMQTIHSTMFQSTREMPSSLVHLSSSARQASCSKPSGFFRLRLHVLSIIASIVDTSRLADDNEYNALCVNINDAVIVSNSTVYTDQSTNEVLNTANKVTLSFNDVSLFEGTSEAGVLLPTGSRRPLLNFYQIPQLNTVYSAPHCEISVDIMNDKAANACSQITVSVKLEPIMVSVVYRYLLRWLETLSGFVVNVSADESSSSISFSVSVSNIDVIVHPDIATPTHVWDDLLLAVDLESELEPDSQFGSSSHTKKHFNGNFSSLNDHSHSRWLPMGKSPSEKGRNGLPQNQNSFIYQLGRHLSGSRAGFRIQWKDLHIRFKSLSGAMSDRKSSAPSGAEQLSEGEVTQLTVSSFIAFPHRRLQQSYFDGGSPSEDRHRYLETIILTASANENLDRKVSLSKEMKSATQSSDSSKAYIHGNDNAASIGPREPHVETHNIININAYRIDADVRQREYNTALIIAETIVPCISTAVPKATESSSSKLHSSIGLKLSSKFATICISEDESKVNASDKMLSTAAILNLLQRFLQLQASSVSSPHTELPIFSTPDFQSLSSFHKELKELDPVSLCLSVHEPMITLLSVKSEIFLSLAADDVNMYEMTTKQFNTLCKEQFQFSKPNSIAELRVGPDSYKIPFIHRAFVRNFGAAEQQRSTSSTSFGSYSTLLGKNNKASEYAFEARLLMTSSLRNRELGNDEIFKTVDFSIDLNDMLMSHDPKSSWLLKAVKILTPQSSLKMRQQNRDDVIEMQLKMLLHAFRKDPKMCLLLSSDLAYQAADSCNDEYLWCDTEEDVLSDSTEPVRRPSLPPLFEITNINIRLRDCLLMYCCGPMSAASVGSEGSRSLLSIGSLTMFTNIASNCERFNLKFTVHDLALHIKDEFTLLKRPPLYHVDSNRSSSSSSSYVKGAYNAHEYSNNNSGQPLQNEDTEHVDLMSYLNSNGFIQLMVIDRVENIVAVNEDGSAEALSLSIAIGICSIHACADSLELFSKVTQRWVSEFQTVCELPPTVRQRRKRRLYIAKHGHNLKVDSSKRPPQPLKTTATEEGLEEEGYTVSPLDSDFRVRYIVDVERENSKAVQGNQDMDAHAGNYYQQDDVYNQDSNLLEDYYSSAGLGNLPAAVADPGSVLSPSPVPSEHEAAWLPQYAYDEEEDDEEVDDNHFFPVEETHSGLRKVQDNEDDDDANTRNDDDESIQSFSSSMYMGRKAVDHPDPQVSRSLFLLNNLTSSLYGSKVAIKPVLEEYELQEISEDFVTCEEINNMNIDEDPSDYIRTSFSNDNDGEYGTVNPEDHGDWLVDTEEHFDHSKSHLNSRDVLKDTVESKESSSVAAIIDSNSRNDIDRIILPVKDINEKPGAPINQRPVGHSNLDDQDVDVFPLLDAEEQATWYYGTEVADVKPYYIPLVTQNEDLDDYRPVNEKQLRTKIKFKIRGSIRVRLFSGTDLTHRRAEPTARTAPVGQSSQALTTKSVRFAPIETPRLVKEGKASPSTARPATENHVADNDLPRERREMLEICAKDFLVTLRLYEENSAPSSEGGDGPGGVAAMVALLPSRRLTGTAQDLLVTFGRTFNSHNHHYQDGHGNEQGVGTQNNRNINLGRRRKVLGLWTSSEKPRDVIQPMFQLSLVGYNVDSSNTSTHSKVGLNEEDNDKSTFAHHQDTESDTTNHSSDLEYRLYVRLLPIRCYLDDYIVSFCKRLVPASNTSPQSTTTTVERKDENQQTDSRPEVAKPVRSGQGTDNLTYFQSITLASTDIKVDYRASEVNLRALQAGDYMQLLNLIPLDGLEITLRHIKINGCAGIGQCVDRILEAWVRDIYANQLYRVISGLAPMKGLSNIGSDLHDLLSLPLSHALGHPGSTSPHQLARMRGGRRPDLLREVRKSTYTFLRTLSRETLKASHTATKFVANAISDLASSTADDDRAQQRYHNSNNHPRRNSHDNSNSNRDRSYSNTHDDDSYYYDMGDDSPNIRRRGSQPVGVMDGLAQACEVVSKEVMTAVDSVIAIPMRHFYRSEEDDAAAGALRAVGGEGGDTCVNSVMKTLPRAILRPMAGLAEGLSFALLGLRNDIDPAARLEEEDIWDVKLSNELKKQSSSQHLKRKPMQQQSHNPNLSSSRHQSNRNNDNSKRSYKK